MWLTPISALSLSLTIKFNYLSEQEIINLGGFVEKNFYKNFFNNTVMIVSIFAAIFICLFPIYIYYAPLDKIAIRTTFIRDSFVTVIFLPYFYYMSSMLVMSLFLNLVFHPITFFKYQYKIPWYGRKDKIRSLVKNKRKNEK
ncbi:hypothetical protein BKK49_09210 [Rodentibacter rarus]|nr:hypothetical protein BKK49_09210 [Rodentibacter rarus]